MNALKDFRISVYDLICYFIPGTVMLFALWLPFADGICPGQLVSQWQLLKQYWYIAILVSYLLGVLAHSAATYFINLFFIEDYEKPFQGSKEAEKDSFWEHSLNRFEERVSDILETDNTGYDKGVLYYIADEAHVQIGNSDEREVYQYRDGFFRAFFISCCFLFLSTIIKLMTTSTVPALILFCAIIVLVIVSMCLIGKMMKIQRRNMYISFACIVITILGLLLVYYFSNNNREVAFGIMLIGMAIPGILLSYSRYKNFKDYRFKRSATAFLINDYYRMKEIHAKKGNGS